jgi:uncharacterized membrane protein YphA (DoxX/SURF4 family)
MTVLRMTVGGLFVGHGTQKLFGWWHGPEGHRRLLQTTRAPSRQAARDSRRRG